MIYRTNLRSSRAAGRFAQLKDPDMVKVRPFWRYGHSPYVQKPRPDHLEWDGLILRHDDPWWNTHYPPNGWGCECSVSPVSRRQMKKHQWKVDRAPKIEWETKTVGKRSPITRTVKTPKGIDPGWAYAPGQRYGEILKAAGRAAGVVNERIATDFVRELVDSETFRNWYDKPIGRYPVARLTDAQAKRLGVKARIAVLSAGTARKQKRNHPELTAADYIAVQDAIDRGELRQVDKRNLAFALEDEGGGYFTVVKGVIQEGGELFLQTLWRMSSDEAKRGKYLDSQRRRGN